MRILNLEDAEQVYEQARTDSALGRTVNVDALLRSICFVFDTIAERDEQILEMEDDVAQAQIALVKAEDERDAINAELEIGRAAIRDMNRIIDSLRRELDEVGNVSETFPS